MNKDLTTLKIAGIAASAAIIMAVPVFWGGNAVLADETGDTEQLNGWVTDYGITSYYRIPVKRRLQVLFL